MPAEQIQEQGRLGLMEAMVVLHRVFGDSIDLPFNAYDHGEKLKFPDPATTSANFSFDLGGTFRRKDWKTVSGSRTVELFVEVKNFAEGSQLKGHYSEFLRRASVVGSLPRHKDSWFMFFTSVPFGTKAGVQLCDGTFLRERSVEWTGGIKPPEGLHLRTVIVFANQSLKRTLDEWGGAR